MRRSTLPILLVAAMLGLSALAFAATFQNDPTVLDEGTTLRVQAAIGGLTANDVTVRVRAVGDARVTCANPADTEPPGQNRNAMRRVTVSGTQTLAASQLTNGTAIVDVTTASPALSARAAGCPSAKWSATIDDVKFQTVTIRVTQNGSLVLQRTMKL